MNVNKVLLLSIVLFCIGLMAMASVSAEDVKDVAIVSNSTDFNQSVDLNNSCLYNVNNAAEFKNVMEKADSLQSDNKTVVINITNTMNNYAFNCDSVLFDFRLGTLLVYGNGATFSSKGDGTFLNVGRNAIVYFVGCQFTDSKPSIRNYGHCTLYNCTLIGNKRADTTNAHGLKREGGAIDNFNRLTCHYCDFNDNRGSYGGAVCGEDNSVNVFIDCTWGNNNELLVKIYSYLMVQSLMFI
ncbi:MAG: hypothetical protein MJ209_03070 [archaeon]|nr:hypothetical protein [archaeon]